MFTQLNIYGKPLEICSLFPMTGEDRTGRCAVFPNETPSMCVVITEEFLKFSSTLGYDFSSRRPGFWGLKHGDRWCLSVDIWLQIFKSQPKAAPYIIPESTHINLLKFISLEEIKPYLI